MITRMVRVLHPRFNPHPNGLYGERVYPMLNDYVEVPYLSTIGGWRMKEMLPLSTIKGLADLANRLEKASGVKRRGLHNEEVRYRA